MIMHEGLGRQQMFLDSAQTLTALVWKYGPGFLDQQDKMGVSVFGRLLFNGDVQTVRVLVTELNVSCNTVAVQVPLGTNPKVVKQHLGGVKLYPAGQPITPLALVR